ncbi:hypothetical protein A3737_22425, partial [Oleiphilus sp. HI0065]
NGEIYNFLELREDLKGEGYAFHTSCDTEVILAAYAHWGDKCTERFNGMWAFAIYDSLKNIIFCSRDRYGIKPFYYSEQKGLFLFGSEIKQLLQFVAQRLPNYDILRDFLVIGLSEHTESTFFDGIFNLPGGHNLTYSLKDKSYEIKRWYEWPELSRPLLKDTDEHTAVDGYRAELYRSVSFRLRADVKVGTCLSGGLDSSSVAGVASHHLDNGDNFTAIHAKSTETKFDESNYAAEVAEKLRLNLEVVEPTFADFLKTIDDVVYAQEEPFGSYSLVMQYLVMRRAKELGIKVLLDGQGGDESLLGYERYYASYIASLPLMQRFKALLKSKANSRLSMFEVLAYQLYFRLAWIRKWRLRRKCKLLSDAFIGDLGWVDRLARSSSSIELLQEQEMQCTQLPHLLRYEDKNSMACSVEARLPFLDYQLVERSLRLPGSLKVKNGWTKYILRNAVAKLLPASIVWRKNKLGFNAPENEWLSKHKAEMREAIKSSKILKKVT